MGAGKEKCEALRVCSRTLFDSFVLHSFLLAGQCCRHLIIGIREEVMFNLSVFYKPRSE